MAFDLHTNMTAAQEIDALLRTIDENTAWEILCLEQMHTLGLMMVVELIKAKIAIGRFYQAGLSDENYEDTKEAYGLAVETIKRYCDGTRHSLPPMIEHPDAVREKYIRLLRLNRYGESAQNAIDAYLDERKESRLPACPEHPQAKSMIRALF